MNCIEQRTSHKCVMKCLLIKENLNESTTYIKANCG